MKTLDASVQIAIVDHCKELFKNTLQVPFDTLEQLPNDTLVRGRASRCALACRRGWF